MSSVLLGQVSVGVIMWHEFRRMRIVRASFIQEGHRYIKKRMFSHSSLGWLRLLHIQIQTSSFTFMSFYFLAKFNYFLGCLPFSPLVYIVYYVCYIDGIFSVVLLIF